MAERRGRREPRPDAVKTWPAALPGLGEDSVRPPVARAPEALRRLEVTGPEVTGPEATGPEATGPKLPGPEATSQPEVEVRRSGRRRRTVSAYRDGERIVVLIPAYFSRAEERRWVAAMVERLRAQESRRKAPSRDLVRRADELSRQYLSGRARPVSIRWVDNQQGRWGSCTPLDGTIRISSRLRGMPGWVVDYVLLHELAHLLEPSHNARFWSLLEPYPKLERARGYLEGVAAAADLDVEPMRGGSADDADGALGPGAFDDRDDDVEQAAEVAARFSGDNPPEPPTLL